MNIDFIARSWNLLKRCNDIRGRSLVYLPVTRWDWLKFWVVSFESALNFGWLIPNFQKCELINAELVGNKETGRVLLHKKGFLTIAERARLDDKEFFWTKAVIQEWAQVQFDYKQLIVSEVIRNRLITPLCDAKVANNRVIVLGQVKSSMHWTSKEISDLPQRLIDDIIEFYKREVAGGCTAPAITVIRELSQEN